MALIQTDTMRETRRRLALAAVPGHLRGATAGFARAAALGAFGVLALSVTLPNAAAVPIALSLAGFIMAASLAGWFVQRAYPHDRLGVCNHITLSRLVLVSALASHVIAGGGPSWIFLGLALVALSLDGVDGWMARRQGLVSGFGARFDVEVDALMALVLALNAALMPQIGLIALVLGLPRYAFVAASIVLPWMQRPLPDRFSRKVICVVQLAALIAMQAPTLPPVMGLLLMLGIAAALIWSFAVDIVWLWRSRA